jgi:hypothetical protein
MQPIFVTLFALILVGALCAWYIKVYHKRPKLEDDTPSYLKRESLLLEHEQRYFATLIQVVGRYARVFPKVRLSDFVQPHGVQPEQRAHWLRVQRRCVDFLLCSPNNLSPVLAIDLDTRVKKRRREQSPGGDVVEKALKAANIPLLRIRATREYDPHEVLHQIRLVLASSEDPVQEWFAEYGEEDEPWWHSILSRVPSLGRWTSELRGAVRRA